MPGVSLPNDVELSYNDYAFDVMHSIESVRSKPNYDSSGRTVTSVSIGLTVKAIITPDPDDQPDTKIHLGLIRNRLVQPGATLRMVGFGFGHDDLVVNPPGGGGVRDVEWGPRPRVLNFRHLGEDQAWELTWDVETTILDQCSEPTYKNKPLEFNYKVSYDVQKGYSKRTYTGHLKIPQSKLDPLDRTLRDNADAYLEQVLPKLPPVGFRRDSQQRELSEDKCTLTFTVVDEEMKGLILPPDVILSDVRRSNKSQAPIWLHNTMTITGRYEIAKGVPRSVAYSRFHALLLDAVANSSKVVKREEVAPTATSPGSKGVPFMPLALSINGGDLHGAEAGSFSFTYFFHLPTGKARYLMEAAGIWRGLPGSSDPASDWKAWATSMLKDEVITPRGYARLSFENADDKLVDLCKVYPPTTPAGRAITAKSMLDVSADSSDRPDENNPFNMKVPKPPDSWVEYKNRLRVIEIDNVAVHQPLPNRPVNYRAPAGSVDARGGFKTGFTNDTPPIIQRRGPPRIEAVLSGYALRAGYEISPPNVTKIGGVDCFPMNDGRDFFASDVVGNMGVPVVFAAWSRRFILAGVPQQGILPPDNPLHGNVVKDDKLDGFTTRS